MSAGILTAVDDLVVRHGANGLRAALSILKAHRPLRTLTPGDEAEGSTAERQRDFVKRVTSLARDADSSKRWVAVHLLAHAVTETSRPLYLTNRLLLWDVCGGLLKRSEELAIRTMSLDCVCALVQRDRALRDQGMNLEAVSNEGKVMSSVMELVKASVAAMVANNSAGGVPTVDMVAADLGKLTKTIQTNPALAKSLVKRIRDAVNPLLHHESKVLRESAVALLCTLPHCVGGGHSVNWTCLLAVLVSAATKCTHKCTSDAFDNAKLLALGEQGLDKIEAAHKSTLTFYQPIAEWESSKTGAARVSENARRLDALCAAIACHLHGQGEAARARARQLQQRQAQRKNAQSTVAPTPAAVPVAALLEMVEVSLVRDTGALLNTGLAATFALCPAVLVSVLSLLDVLVACGRKSLLRHLPRITAFVRRLLRAVAAKSASNPYAVPQVAVAALRLGERLATTWGAALDLELAAPLLETATREVGDAERLPATSRSDGQDDVANFERKSTPKSSAKSTRKHKAKFRTMVTVEHDDSGMHLNPSSVVERLVAASCCITSVLLAAGCNVDPALRSSVDEAVLGLLRQRGLASSVVRSSVTLRCSLLKAVHASVLTPESGSPRSQALVSAMEIANEYLSDVDPGVATVAGLLMATCSALIHPRGISLRQVLQGPNMMADPIALRSLVSTRDAWEHVPIGGPAVERGGAQQEEGEGGDDRMVVDSSAAGAVEAVVESIKSSNIPKTKTAVDQVAKVAEEVAAPSKKRGRDESTNEGQGEQLSSQEKKKTNTRTAAAAAAPQPKPVAAPAPKLQEPKAVNNKIHKPVVPQPKPVVDEDDDDDDDDESLPSIVDDDPDM
jgi:hypothetical protein